MAKAVFAVLLALAVLAAAQQCPYPLRPTQAEHLVEPPILAQSLSGPLGDVVDLNITVPQTVPARSNVTAIFGIQGTLEGLENWCMLNTTLRLNGIQTTHADPTTPDETLRFFVGDVVHVRDHVYTDLTLTATSIVSAVLSGDALRAAGPVTIYAGTPGSEAYGFALEACPAATDPTWVCYRFQLADADFVVDRSLTITTSLSVAIDQHGRRSPAATQTARLSNSVTFAATTTQPAGAASALSVAFAALVAAALLLF
eukprot:m51a1_g14659 hypothetical protein (257) ;mRNA; f:9138-10378